MKNRNLAFYKKDGKPWTLEELNNISIHVGDGPINDEDITDDCLKRKYIFDNGLNHDFMYFWQSQEKNRNFKNCRKIAYEDIFTERINNGSLHKND